MATDGPTPPPCDGTIFTEGAIVTIVAGVASNAMEGWVKRVAEVSGQAVDCHFSGGRAVVKTIGNVDRALAAVDQLLPDLYRLAPRVQVAF